jgi:hypothetical protein
MYIILTLYYQALKIVVIVIEWNKKQKCIWKQNY